jgi:hypothetical protein
LKKNSSTKKRRSSMPNLSLAHHLPVAEPVATVIGVNDTNWLHGDEDAIYAPRNKPIIPDYSPNDL